MLTRLPIFIAILLGLLAFAGVAYAQGQPVAPTIESTAITSNPGNDGGYAIGDVIEIGLTFSAAVTVSGAPKLSLDIGGQRKDASYTGAADSGARLLFAYTVAEGDEDADGIEVVADSLTLNGGGIQAAGGLAAAALSHSALQDPVHAVDGIAPTVIRVDYFPKVAGRFVRPEGQFTVSLAFSEPVYGLTDSEIRVTNGSAHDADDVWATSEHPAFTRWNFIVAVNGEGPITVDLEERAAEDAVGNAVIGLDSPLEVIAANPVTVRITPRNTSVTEDRRAEFIITRSRDNGNLAVSMTIDLTGDFFRERATYTTASEFAIQSVALHGPSRTFDMFFEPGETQKRLTVSTRGDQLDEPDGSVAVRINDNPGQYLYVPGFPNSAATAVRDDDEPFEVGVSLTPRTVREGTLARFRVYRPSNRLQDVLAVYGRFSGDVGLLDLQSNAGNNLEVLEDNLVKMNIPHGLRVGAMYVPIRDDSVIGPGGSVTFEVVPPPVGSHYVVDAYNTSATVRIEDNDSPPTVTVEAGGPYGEGQQVVFTIVRTSVPTESWERQEVGVLVEQTGDHLAVAPTTEPVIVTLPAGQYLAYLRLNTVDDDLSEINGAITATVQPSPIGEGVGGYLLGSETSATATVIDNEIPIISVEPVTAEVTEGADASFRLRRLGNNAVRTTVGLYVGGHPKMMTDATEAIVLYSEQPGVVYDQRVDFEVGETEKLLNYTTEADNINEGDGLLTVTIIGDNSSAAYRVGESVSADVLVVDDDIPTISIRRPVAPADITLSESGDTWLGEIIEGDPVSVRLDCTGDYQYSEYPLQLRPLLLVVNENNHPGYYGPNHAEFNLGNNTAHRTFRLNNCTDEVLWFDRVYRHRYVGPEGGVERVNLSPFMERPFQHLTDRYWAAKAEADSAGVPITEPGIFHPNRIADNLQNTGCYDEQRFCPKYSIGAINAIELEVVNRDPSILIKAESGEVTEGQPARFIVERRWAQDVTRDPHPYSTTVVALRVSQNGRYITGALPTEITFGQNEHSKVIELPTLDDTAFGAHGSVTVEILRDTTGPGVNVYGKYSIHPSFRGHTPEGGRSDRATVAIRNEDDLAALSIAPASAREGNAGDSNTVDFVVSLPQAAVSAVKVDYATSDGAAVAGEDYEAKSGTLTIPAGSSSGAISIAITGDDTSEPDETFTLVLSNPVNVGISGGATTSVTGSIINDDLQVLTIKALTAQVEEGDPIILELERAGYIEEELHAKVYADRYSALEMRTVRVHFNGYFPPGAATAQVSVDTSGFENDIVDDLSLRYTGDFMLLGDQAGEDLEDEVWVPGDPSTAQARILDDDELTIVTIHAQETFVAEGGRPAIILRRHGDDFSKPLDVQMFRDTIITEAFSAILTCFRSLQEQFQRANLNLSSLTTLHPCYRTMTGSTRLDTSKAIMAVSLSRSLILI